MLRLFCSRLLKGKNPFIADKNHLHHLFLSKFKYFHSFLLIQSLIIIPLVYYTFKNSNILIALTISISLYFTSLFILKNKEVLN